MKRQTLKKVRVISVEGYTMELPNVGEGMPEDMREESPNDVREIYVQ